MQSVFIATPAYDGRVHTAFVASLIETLDALRAAGIPARWERIDGCCYLPVVRNKLVRSFLASSCSDFVFIDADMAWPAAGLMKLLRHDRDIVGGVQPFKVDGRSDFPVRIHTEPDGRPKVDPYTGLIEAEGLPTSFLRIKRAVFDRIAAAEGENLEVHEYGPGGVLLEKYLNFFDCQHDGHMWWGEDYNFCRLAARHGFRLWVEPDISFGHLGGKMWTGNYHDHLRALPGGGGGKPGEWRF